jgi:hypothetical protein
VYVLKTINPIARAKEVKTTIKGVHIYGLARPSLQPQANRIGRINLDVLENIAKELHKLGVPTTVSY